MRHPVLRYGAAALCVLGAVYFLLPLSMGVLHIGMLYPAAGLLLAAVWLVFPGLFRLWPRWLRRTVCVVLVAGVLLYTLIGSGKSGADRPDPPKNPTEDVDPNQPATPTVKLSLDQTALELTVGGTGKLTATGAEGITWTSSNAGVAAVGEDGTVTAVAAGTATISASAEGADPVTCTVTVKEAPKKDLVLRSIYNSKGVAQTEFSMSVGDPVVPMTVDGTDSPVQWSTEDSSIATINSDGEVTAVKSGKTMVVAVVDGQTLKCEVLVN